MNFPVLNLPAINPRLQRGAGGRVQIYDGQRKRFVTLTAEEWVRQHFVQFLINVLNYPSSLVANEVTLQINGVARRCDTVVYSPLDGHPLLIVEYKSTRVSVTRDVFAQVQGYNSVCHADYLVVSNGLRHFCCHNDYEKMTASFLPEIPTWEQINPKKRLIEND